MSHSSKKKPLLYPSTRDEHNRIRQIVECTGCGDTISAAPTNSGPYNNSGMESWLKSRGWKPDGKGHALCPICRHGLGKRKSAEVIPMSKTAAEPPNEPTRDAKRRIRKEVQDHYDEDRGRYIGEASDVSIAESLKVPRAWVTQIREEFFGDSGENEEVQTLRREADEMLRQLGKLDGDILELQDKFERQMKVYYDRADKIRDAVSRIEKKVERVLP